MASPSVTGIHHITAIAGPPQKNLDFYTGILGLRLVKKTVNYDAHSVYHLYFGDRTGQPGANLTFFPWPNARSGRPGRGQVSAIAFAVPPPSLEDWAARLDENEVSAEWSERMDESFLRFRDPDGLPLELVATEEPADATPWTGGPVPEALAVKAFHAAEVRVDDPEPLAAVLTGLLGFERERAAGDRDRYGIGGEGSRARHVDVIADPKGSSGREGAGTVHHIAFRVPDEKTQKSVRERFVEAGLNPTPPVDRHYFQSVYVRVPGGVLFEIATDQPGFLIDEDESELGSGLRLPPWLESQRSSIEEQLPELDTKVATQGNESTA